MQKKTKYMSKEIKLTTQGEALTITSLYDTPPPNQGHHGQGLLCLKICTENANNKFSVVVPIQLLKDAILFFDKKENN